MDVGDSLLVDYKSALRAAQVEVEIADNVTVEVIRGTGVQSLMNNTEVKK